MVDAERFGPPPGAPRSHAAYGLVSAVEGRPGERRGGKRIAQHGPHGPAAGAVARRTEPACRRGAAQ